MTQCFVRIEIVLPDRRMHFFSTTNSALGNEGQVNRTQQAMHLTFRVNALFVNMPTD